MVDHGAAHPGRLAAREVVGVNRHRPVSGSFTTLFGQWCVRPLRCYDRRGGVSARAHAFHEKGNVHHG